MSHYPATVIHLIQALSRLPGIGAKTAERMALHILHMPDADARRLADSIVALKSGTGLCRTCFSLSDGATCRICANPARDAGVICVVEQQADMVAIEKSGGYNGLYHILHGVLSPMDGIGPEDIRIRELLERVGSQAVKEVIIATSVNVEGDATASYLATQLARFPVQVTRIASGVPVGGDLKYVDQITLKRAMETRRGL